MTSVDVAIRVCKTCDIEVIVDHNIVREHCIPPTNFRCPSSGTAWCQSQKVIDDETEKERNVKHER